MIKFDDVKFFVKYTKENPKEAFNVIAQAIVLTSGAMIVGVLITKGATALAEELKARK